MNDNFSQGLARAHTADYVYESGFHLVQRAPWTLVTYDVQPDLIAFELYEDTADAHGWLDLRNTGQYAGPAPPIIVGAQVKIAVGYYTTAGNVASPLQDFWITAIEHRRELHKGRGLITTRLYLEGGLRRLRRSFQRRSSTRARRTTTARSSPASSIAPAWCSPSRTHRRAPTPCSRTSRSSRRRADTPPRSTSSPSSRTA